MKLTSPLFGNLLKSVGASGFQFLITLFSTPIMTRIYAPEAYATFGILNGAAVLIVGIGMLSLPTAYTMEKQSSARIALVRMMLLLLCGLVLFSTLISVGVAVSEKVDFGIPISTFALVLFPLLVLSTGMRQIVLNIAVDKAHFNSTALVHIIEPICARGGGIGLGALWGGNPVYILLSVIIGQIAAIFTICRLVLKDILQKWRSYFVADLKPLATLRRHSDFIWFNTASMQIHAGVMLVIQVGIASFFSAEFSGHYILAISILSLPATLIAFATSSIVYKHFINIEAHTPEQLPRHFIIAMVCYLLIGLGVLAPIFVFGKEIFHFVFGAAWEHSGFIASMMSISYVAMFGVVGVQSIFRVTRRLKLQFILEVSTCILMVIAIIFCFKTMEFDRAIYYMSLIWLLKNTTFLIGCIIVVRQHQHTVTNVAQ